MEYDARVLPERPVVVIAASLLQRELCTRRGADGPVEAVPHAPVQVAREERFERVVQCRVSLEINQTQSCRYDCIQQSSSVNVSFYKNLFYR